MKNWLVSLPALLALAIIPTVASAARYAKRGADGKAHVAHTRLAPVLMHRAFPPYTGIHVYERGGSESRNTGAENNSNNNSSSNASARRNR
jgi:hypothetical protein